MATHIDFEVRGIEQNFWKRMLATSGGTRRFQEVKTYNNILNYDAQVYQFPNNQVQPGQYVMGFQVMLPEGLPGSMQQKWPGYAEAYGKISYYVRAYIRTVGEPYEMKHK